jgi:Zn-dependent protease
MSSPRFMPAWFQFRRARILGARVYVHWSVLVVIALIGLVSFNSPIHAAVAIASYLAVIVIHEAGHAWVAHRLGYEVDAIHVAFLHGYCTHDMPYNETDHVMIAWGGVAAQLAVAIPILTVATIFDRQDFGYAAPAIAFLGYVNILIALVNLAPAAGLDGQIAWRAVPLLWRRATAGSRRRRSQR